MARWEFNLVCTSVYMYEERGGGGSDYVVVKFTVMMLLLLLIYFRNIVLRYGYAKY